MSDHNLSNIGLEQDWTMDEVLSDPRCARWREHLREHGVDGAALRSTDALTVFALHHRLHSFKEGDHGPQDTALPDGPFLERAETLSEAVFQSLGAASACWEHLDRAGIFESTRCKAIGEELMMWIATYPNRVVVDMLAQADTPEKRQAIYDYLATLEAAAAARKED